MFALPTRKTINKFLSEIPYGTGISEHVMHCIKSTTSFNNENKICIVAFDEISLEAGLAYSAREDAIYGFDSATADINFCDHALVFMATGVYKRWKQPLAYYFSKEGVSTVHKCLAVVLVLHDEPIACASSNTGHRLKLRD
ncbi:Transposase protein [Popillia japonica]|uniref:Transposase protein n=1 Tax=Popillia japonica TaxID=7064 RepID=A0AAW1N4T1_POPJA